MSKQLTILVAPVDVVGHVNACIGLAEALQNRGHKIIFSCGKVWQGKLAAYGFLEDLLDNQLKQKDTKPGEHVADTLSKMGMFSAMTPFEKMEQMIRTDNFTEMISNVINVEPQLKQIVDKHKPDVIIVDHFIGLPAIIYSDRPWVFLWSGNPLFVIDSELTPPPGSGFPSDGDKNSKEWKEFRELKASELSAIHYNQWLKEKGFPEINNKRCMPDSPYLNLYGFPQELDYTGVRPNPDKWFNVDSFARKGEQGEFVLPDIIKDRDENQKLIYLSLGSMGSANIELMSRLIQILAKSPHKFIVSKGILGDKYELADNMWGQNSVPQTKVLPLVDLVITHGGNNTLTETLTQGKPLIVMPLFGDQFDNAQSVHENGYGIRVEGHTCTEQELLGAIDKLLNDNDLKDRLKAASKRMANSNGLVKASELIEKLVK